MYGMLLSETPAIPSHHFEQFRRFTCGCISFGSRGGSFGGRFVVGLPFQMRGDENDSALCRQSLGILPNPTFVALSTG